MGFTSFSDRRLVASCVCFIVALVESNRGATLAIDEEGHCRGCRQHQESHHSYDDYGQVPDDAYELGRFQAVDPFAPLCSSATQPLT